MIIVGLSSEGRLELGVECVETRTWPVGDSVGTLKVVQDSGSWLSRGLRILAWVEGVSYGREGCRRVGPGVAGQVDGFFGWCFWVMVAVGGLKGGAWLSFRVARL